MAMTAGQFLTLLQPGLANIWFEAQQERESQFDRWANVRQFEKIDLEDAKMAGFGTLQTMAEGQDVTFEEAIAPVTKTYNSTMFGLGYVITDKLIRKELYGQVERFERALSRSSADHIEVFAHAILNNATNTTISAGFDGLSLANTAHTRLDGGATQSNSLSQALSLAALHDMWITFDNWVDDRGRPIRVEPDLLVVPPDLWPTAVELLDSEMRPDTANNATNVVNRFGLSLMRDHYLDSTTFWGVFGTNHDVNFIWDLQPERSSEEVFENKNVKRMVRQGYGRGHGEWRGFLLGNS